MSNTVLEIKDLKKVFTDGGPGLEVLSDVSLSVEKGEFLCILGPSGCGKSTLLRCIAGFETYDGDVLVDGKKVTEPGTDRFMVFQTFDQLFPWKTVEQNIDLPLKLSGMKDKEERKKVTKRVLESVRLDGFALYYPHQMSGGMKQRTAIAKALALRPEIILMDEPFAALDAMTRRDLQQEVLKVFDGATVLFVTHNIQEAVALGTRILVFGSGGKIVVDMKNPLEKPITPASPEFGAVWDKLNKALHNGEN